MSTVLRGNLKDERLPEIEHLRFALNWTLQQIADKYGITRERVRQLIGNTGSGYIVQQREKIAKKNQNKSNGVLANLLGIKSVHKYRDTSVRHEIEGGYSKIGTESENAVSKKLTRLGISNKLMPHHHAFDILLDNGIRVDVKSSDPMKMSVFTPMYNFRTKAEIKKNYCDFLILHLRDVNEFFVVPLKECNTIIRFSFPEPDKGRKSKWHQYHNRFDLLKG